MLAMGQGNKVLQYTSSGLHKMTATVLILIGAGGIAGLISASDLSNQVVHLIELSGISGTFLAPISGILIAAATASTSTGVIVATGSFGQAILDMDTAPLAAAVMVHTGATVIDSLPQGTYLSRYCGQYEDDDQTAYGAHPLRSACRRNDDDCGYAGLRIFILISISYTGCGNERENLCTGTGFL